jgi:hypothetical protein
VESSEQAHPRSAGRSVAGGIVVLAMMLAAISLWTVIPLSWVYIGSQIADSQFPSGGPYMIVFIGIVISILIIAWLLSRLNGLYIRITGTNTMAPMRPAWLKSMRDEEVHRGTTVMEAVIVGSVLLAVLALVTWFFLLAGSPLPDQ